MAEFGIDVVVNADSAERGIDSVTVALNKVLGSVDGVNAALADTLNASNKSFGELADSAASTQKALGAVSLPPALPKSVKETTSSFNVAGQAVDKFSKKIKSIPGDIGKFAAGALTGLVSGLAIGAVGKLFEPPSREDLKALAEANEQLVILGQNISDLAAEELRLARMRDGIIEQEKRHAGIREKAIEDARAVEIAEEALRITTRALDFQLKNNTITEYGHARALAIAEKALDDVTGATERRRQATLEFEAINRKLAKDTEKIFADATKAANDAAAEYKQFKTEVISLRDEFDPAGAALRRFAEIEDIVERATSRGRKSLIGRAEATKIMAEAQKQLNATLAESDFAKADIVITESDIERQAKAQEERRADDRRTYNAYVEGLTRAGEKQKEGEKAYGELQEEIRKRNKEAEEERIDQIRESSKAIADFMSPIFDGIVDGTLDSAQAWSDMIQSMLRDLAKLAIKALAVRAITTALGGGAIPSPAGGLTDLLGFAHGGSGTVGGSGGTDSQIVAFRATPGEQVTVATPRQQQAMGNQSAPIVRNRIVNVIDPRMSIDAMSSSDGESVTLNHIKSNAATIKALLR